MKVKEYAVYKGDTFIDLGTVDELAERLNLSRKTILWYASCKRWKKEAKKGNCIIVILIK